jgi:hypothetical protein
MARRGGHQDSDPNATSSRSSEQILILRTVVLPHGEHLAEVSRIDITVDTSGGAPGS